MILPYIAPILLLVCGLLLTFEIYNRVKRAILISPWLVQTYGIGVALCFGEEKKVLLLRK